MMKITLSITKEKFPKEMIKGLVDQSLVAGHYPTNMAGKYGFTGRMQSSTYNLPLAKPLNTFIRAIE